MYHKYLTEFAKLNCSSDLLEYGLYSNAGQITESMGVFSAVRKYIIDPCDEKQNPNSIYLISIENGTVPYIGSLFAFRTKWNVISICPNCSPDSGLYIKRMKIFSGGIEDYKERHDGVIIFVVPHVDMNLNNLLNLVNYGIISVVHIPYSKSQKKVSKEKPFLKFKDFKIMSPGENSVHIWKNISVPFSVRKD